MMLRSLFRPSPLLVLLASVSLSQAQVCGTASSPANPASTSSESSRLELSRPVRPWEFLDAVGPRAGLFGNEAGQFEAWVYPLKIFRDFTLRFHYEGHIIPAESLARTVTVRPESSSILYASDSFSVVETFFVPPEQSGAVIRIETESRKPLEVEAVFRRDFELMWPAGLGGTYAFWDEKLHGFVFGEEQKKFFAVIGAAEATPSTEEYVTNYTTKSESGFLLPSAAGKQAHTIAIAAALDGRENAEATYRLLAAQSGSLQQEAAKKYQNYLQQTISLTLPDPKLQCTYDWSRISMLQGLVTNPLLGTGLIAGYRTSGTSARPGFAWFFGRDSLWTSFALDSEGDFEHARAALDFLSKYQRTDGKIEHEISQSATLVPWFTNYPYAYASADATPLYLIAMREYAVASGDVGFVKEKWDSIWRAYQFLRSTWDADGLPQNQNVGHGWVEGGPLLPVKTELYQSGLGTEAIHALAELAHLTGQEKIVGESEERFGREKKLVNQLFWSAENHSFAFALDASNKKLATPSVLATVPMWFGVLDQDKSNEMIDVLAGGDQQSDWGMRIISSRDARYDPSGYHFGSVWPLFTGWASVGEYRYHRPLPAYANLMANAQLALDGSLGHVTEVLSGDFYQPLSTSSPHQIWSSAMVVSPLLRGLLGLEVSVPEHRLTLAPHVPADWRHFEMRNLRVGEATLDAVYDKNAEGITLRLNRRAPGTCKVVFAPAVSPYTQVTGAEINDRPVQFKIEPHSTDQHVRVEFPLYGGETTLHIRLRNDFGIASPSELPPLGEKSRNLKITSERWNAAHDQLELGIAGIPGESYELNLFGNAPVASVRGAELVSSAKGMRKLKIVFPAAPTSDYVEQKIELQFGKRFVH